MAFPQMKLLFLWTTTILLIVTNTDTRAGEVKDLLFHCRLSDAKQSYAIDMTGKRLFDNQGWVYQALISKISISAMRRQTWDEGSYMTHKITINRINGALKYEVIQMFTQTGSTKIFVNELGKCSPEKIHPRHFQD